MQEVEGAYDSLFSDQRQDFILINDNYNSHLLSQGLGKNNVRNFIFDCLQDMDHKARI